ncbi:MAG: hypothetical protein JWO73_325 [Candidatus Taylorbacteria bacterium]|nr:hypothetical protein [Candidatus Taylorbacteria bacterium]
MPSRSNTPQQQTRIFEDYRKAVAFVESFSNTSLRNNFGPEKRDPSFYLDRPRWFCKLIGNPEAAFKCVHITGTAGKGSVSTMTHEILLAAGKKAGLFTSPYVTTTIEKFRVGNAYISPKEFVETVEYLKPFIEQAKSGPYGAPSAFDIFVAIAFIFFKNHGCEWVVLEVGLGGRYDSTNVIERPAVTAITNIDYDHTEILGKTLGLIAYDKAGIIKNGSAFFTTEQRPALLSLFRKICKEQGATFNHIPKQKSYADYNRLLASSIAKAAVSAYGGEITQAQIDAGLAHAKLPCRFEIIQENPLIILDGAHNRAKIQSTVENLKQLRRKTKTAGGFKRLIAIVAISDTKKDNRAILEPLAAVADVIYATSIEKGERRSVHPAALLPYIEKYKKSKATVEVVLDAHMALKKARAAAAASDCIIATGSFFLAGELRTEWYPEEWVLEHLKSFR